MRSGVAVSIHPVKLHHRHVPASAAPGVGGPRRHVATARTLLILHDDPSFRAQIEGIDRSLFQVRWAADWQALRGAVQDAPPDALVVVDPFADLDGWGAPAPALRALLREYPSISVLAALRLRRGVSPHLRTLGEWGVEDLISIDEDDTPEAVVLRLRLASGRPLQRLLEGALPAAVSGRARSLLLAAAEVVSLGGRGRELARTLHLSERTVSRWAERSGLPSPRRVMAWMRILLASSLLDDPGRTVLGAARACGYASDGGLRRAMQDFISMPPTELRRRGAFSHASRAFADELRRVRESHRVRGGMERRPS